LAILAILLLILIRYLAKKKKRWYNEYWTTK
jgi:hypothetical protein